MEFLDLDNYIRRWVQLIDFDNKCLKLADIRFIVSQLG